METWQKDALNRFFTEEENYLKQMKEKEERKNNVINNQDIYIDKIADYIIEQIKSGKNQGYCPLFELVGDEVEVNILFRERFNLKKNDQRLLKCDSLEQRICYDGKVQLFYLSLNRTQLDERNFSNKTIEWFLTRCKGPSYRPMRSIEDYET